MNGHGVAVLDSKTRGLDQDLLLRRRESGAKCRCIPEERQAYPAGMQKYRIDFVQFQLAVVTHPFAGIVMQYNGAARRLERVHVRTAGEIPETQRLERLLKR